MKIAFIHNALTFYRVELFNRLSRLFDVKFFFYGRYGETSEEIEFDYKFMKGSRFPFIDPEYKWPLFLFFDLIKGRYDVFIGSGASQIETMVTFLVAKLLKKPFIIWNELWFYNDSFLSKLRFPFFHYIVLNSYAVVVPGSASKKFHLKIGVSDDKIHISPNTSRINLDQPDLEQLESLKKELNILDSDFLVLCFSRLSGEKGLEYLIESYRYLENQNVKYIIATTMEYESQYFDHLNKIASKINKDNIIITKIDESEKDSLFCLCDLFVLPSIFRRNKGPDIWGLVLNEALSIGMPLIATNMVGGAYDMIKHGKNGFIVPEKDPEEIAKAVIKIKRCGNIEAMREHSLSLFSNFKMKNEVQGFIDAIELID